MNRREKLAAKKHFGPPPQHAEPSSDLPKGGPQPPSGSYRRRASGKEESVIANIFALYLDDIGCIWVGEIGTWLYPNKDRTYRIVGVKEMQRIFVDMFNCIAPHIGGYSNAKLRGVMKLTPMMQSLTREVIGDDYIVFEDGLLNALTFEFEKFPEEWNADMIYDPGERVSFMSDTYEATEVSGDDKPPSANLTKWKRLRPKVSLIRLPVSYKKAVEGKDDECPKWMEFLRQMFVDENGEPDDDLIEHISLMCGYVLMPHLKANRIFMLYGPTAANGKSTFLSILKRLMPEGTVEEKNMDDFASAKKKNWGMADMVGKRLNICNEESSKNVDSGIVKQLSDGLSKIPAERKFQDPFSFYPQFKTVAAFNTPPQFNNIDEGLLRRVIVIPCNAEFDGSRQTADIVKDVLSEKVAIMSWMIRHAKRLCERNWKFPGMTENMKQTQVDIVATQNSVLDFCIGRFMPDDDSDGIPTDSIYREYVEWCRAAGRGMPFSKIRFGQIAGKRYLGKSVAKHGIRYRLCRRLHGESLMTEGDI